MNVSLPRVFLRNMISSIRGIFPFLVRGIQTLVHMISSICVSVLRFLYTKKYVVVYHTLKVTLAYILKISKISQ